jgi:antitoxin CcdA
MNTPKRRPVTFTIREDFIEQARALSLNASRAAERGLEVEIKRALEQAWLRDNAKAIASHNKRIAEKGVLLTPIWARR